MYITSPKKFAALFNEKYVGTNRKITAEDVSYMTACKIICRHGYYLRDDLEIVRGVLEYEQMRGQSPTQEPADDKLEPLKCKRCGQPLPYQQEAKKGRRREYCQECEPSRGNDRYQKWRRKGR